LAQTKLFRWLALGGVVGPLVFVATITIAGALRPGYSPIQQAISASSAELYALISSLSGLPIRQGLAVTGSVNQRGEVQAVGGVNQKIEGFFSVCAAGGLTGNQGVIIPEANTRNLMLRERVVSAVQNGTFHIYAVHSVDEGIELLTGVPAGERNAEGVYPKKTVNWYVDQTLRTYFERMHDVQAGAATVSA
jgi:hypothetical protein